MRPVSQIESKTHTQASLYFCLYGDFQRNNTLPWPLNPNLTPFLNSTLKRRVNPQQVALWCKFNDTILYQMKSTLFRWPHIYQILFQHPQAQRATGREILALAHFSHGLDTLVKRASVPNVGNILVLLFFFFFFQYACLKHKLYISTNNLKALQ